MRLAPPVFIAEDKLTDYLIIPLPKNDKSGYLQAGGYTLDTWQVLKEDLEKLTLTSDAQYAGSSVFGDSYYIIGVLTGPTGRSLAVKTVWMREINTGIAKFITLYPP